MRKDSAQKHREYMYDDGDSISMHRVLTDRLSMKRRNLMVTPLDSSEIIIVLILRPMPRLGPGVVGVVSLALQVVNPMPEELKDVPGCHHSSVDHPDPTEDL